MKLVELLRDESCWVQNHFAVDASGESVPVDSPAACRWCLNGALQRCYDIIKGNEAMLKIYEIINRDHRLDDYVYYCALIHFNDNHSFAEIQAVLREADV